MEDDGLKELLDEFKKESNSLIRELEELLDDIEDDFSKKDKLNNFAQIIDRIMGSAQSLSTFGFEQVEITKLGDFAELCKQIGYRGANLNDEEFYNVTVAFLFDSIESMKKLLTSIGSETQVVKISDLLVSTFLSRLKWILDQFEVKKISKTNYTKAQGIQMKSQDEIDALLKSLSS